MKRASCEFDALIGAQGFAYRCRVWARSRQCIATHGFTLASVGLVAMIITGTAAFPMLFLSTEHDLARLLSR
ncbi:MAG: hypothetical protein JWM34_1301 [Ilumatobacteraceae bacterium]|nr:hypothetical protein [Ilumatobacteraceae bacterium]